MAAESRALLSHEEYFALEQATGERYEYAAGRVALIAGSRPTHSLIAANVVTCLGLQLRQRPCKVYNCSLRIAIGALDFYTYADAIVIADAPRTDAFGESLTNPLVLIEVSSPEIASYDRTRKFMRCRSLESLRDYVLIDQHAPFLQRFSRNEQGRWFWEGTDDLDTSIALPSIECALPLAEVYAKVIFGETAE